MPSHKTNQILQIILIACLIIFVRVWHLGVIQREEKLMEAEKPKSKTVIVRANRGPIYDRFHIPLAMNKICYQATFYYGQITQIPTIGWKIDQNGKKVRFSPRKEHIKKLSHLLGDILSMDPLRIEDLIYAKASLFPHAPFVIKTALSEQEHYRLKALEKDWLGLHAEIGAERFYPLGKTASHIIGTMGAINAQEYHQVASELALLQEALEPENRLSLQEDKSQEALYQRFYELKEKAYTLHDFVGKSGIEKQFETELRGYFGKKILGINQKGQSIQEMPGGRKAVPGRQIRLAISAELQQFAEELLIQNEAAREGRSFGIDPVDHKKKSQKQPWIKGGAIAVLNPHTGEVLALASYPRFDPNDFISSQNTTLHASKQQRIHQWLESRAQIGNLWDGQTLLSRERSQEDKPIEEKASLTWDLFLQMILPQESPFHLFFQRIDKIQAAVQVQEDFETIRYFAGPLSSLTIMEQLSSLPLPQEAKEAQKRLDAALLSLVPVDKLFAIDLCRLVVDATRFSDALLQKTGFINLSFYRSLTQSFQRIEKTARVFCEKAFEKHVFQDWRKEYEKDFLKSIRKKEKEKKTYARPYLDYLDQKKQELFKLYWEKTKYPILLSWIEQEPHLYEITKHLSSELKIEFLKTFRSFKELDRPLLHPYPRLRRTPPHFPLTEQDLAASFYPKEGFGFYRSYAYQSSAPLGSIFKLVTAYEALRQKKHPLILIDRFIQLDHSNKEKSQILAYTPEGKPYNRIYKGGRLPKSATSQIGKIDVVGALEQSSNPFFAILAGDVLQDPDDLLRAAQWFGFGDKTEIALPFESRGQLPSDLKKNRTGLYSFAIGQHTLLTTPLQTAVMLSALVNGGKILKPKLILECKGLKPNRDMLSLFSRENSLAQRELSTLGIPFALFTQLQSHSPLLISETEPQIIKRLIPMDPSVRDPILEGMHRCVAGNKGSARASMIRSVLTNPDLLKDYLALEHQMIGKTSTAEILFCPNKNPSNPPHMYKHTWFGAIAFPEFPQKSSEDAELVVVVFLRYANNGREGAPLAAQIIHKWRQIQASYSQE